VEFDNKINISDALKQLEDRSQALTESILVIFLTGRFLNYPDIQGAPIRWIMLNISLPISMSCMVIGLMPMIRQLYVDWHVLKGSR